MIIIKRGVIGEVILNEQLIVTCGYRICKASICSWKVLKYKISVIKLRYSYDKITFLENSLV